MISNRQALRLSGASIKEARSVRWRSAAEAPEEIVNAMTVDVEDYFHVEAFAQTIDRRDWDGLPRRVRAEYR